MVGNKALRLIRIGLTAAMAAFLMATQPALAAPAKIPVRVVVVTTFEIGADTGDTPGEFQTWVEKLPLPNVLPFPTGNHVLRYNPRTHVLGLVTGSGSVNAAASVMALGLDPRFDLKKAYWVLAGIAGVDPNYATVGSAAWAEWVVDRDLTHEIDAREIPPDWSTGLVPLTRSKPFQAPPPDPGIFSPNAYHLNPGLTEWAFELTKGVKLDDTPDLKGIRAGYADYPEAAKPPTVLKGDEITAMAWWLGGIENKTAERWVDYWTGGKGRSVMSAMEDSGAARSLQLLTKAGRADYDRFLVLRTASDFTVPPKGQTAAELLASESSPDSATKLTAFLPSLAAAYRTASPVVIELSTHWDRYEDHPPTAAP